MVPVPHGVPRGRENAVTSYSKGGMLGQGPERAAIGSQGGSPVLLGSTGEAAPQVGLICKPEETCWGSKSRSFQAEETGCVCRTSSCSV